MNAVIPTFEWMSLDENAEKFINEILPTWKKILLKDDRNETRSFYGKSKKNPSYQSTLFLANGNGQVKLTFEFNTKKLKVDFIKQYVNASSEYAYKNNIEVWTHSVKVHTLDRFNTLLEEIYKKPIAPETYTIVMNLDIEKFS